MWDDRHHVNRVAVLPSANTGSQPTIHDRTAAGLLLGRGTAAINTLAGPFEHIRPVSPTGGGQ